MTEHTARLKKGSDIFEIIVDPDRALEFRKKGGSIDDALLVQKVFSDAKKGLAASENRMKVLFGTSDVRHVAEIILKQGQIQVSAEYRQKQREQKRHRIIEIIHRNAIDPRSNVPHPITRIEAALNEAKVRIDEAKSPEEQVDHIVDKLRPVLPLKFVVKELHITISVTYASKSHAVVRQYGKVLKERWDSQGNWEGNVEIPGGLEPEFYDKLNKVTHGNNAVTVVRQS